MIARATILLGILTTIEAKAAANLPHFVILGGGAAEPEDPADPAPVAARFHPHQGCWVLGLRCAKPRMTGKYGGSSVD
jgi:hypothetical protein